MSTDIEVGRGKGVADAAIRYTARWKAVYKLEKRYDGTLGSLKARSRASHRPQADGGHCRGAKHGVTRKYGRTARTGQYLLRKFLPFPWLSAPGSVLPMFGALTYL